MHGTYNPATGAWTIGNLGASVALTFALAGLPVSAAGTYDRIIVKIEFKATAGTAWFDNASLVFVP